MSLEWVHPVYIVEVQDGSYEDQTHEIVWAGTNEEEAFKAVHSMEHERNSISIWDGVCLSSYMRDATKDDRGTQFGKWERNSGAKIPRLEAE